MRNDENGLTASAVDCDVAEAPGTVVACTVGTVDPAGVMEAAAQVDAFATELPEHWPHCVNVVAELEDTGQQRQQQWMTVDVGDVVVALSISSNDDEVV